MQYSRSEELNTLTNCLGILYSCLVLLRVYGFMPSVFHPDILTREAGGCNVKIFSSKIPEGWGSSE